MNINSKNAPRSTGYDNETGLPESKEYLERGLPLYLQASLRNMIASWEIVDIGGEDYHWDMTWSELNAEVEQEISTEQAWYLREKYLRMNREDL